MPKTEKCEKCHGSGSIHALVSMHDDKKEWVKCPECDGKGVRHWMTEEEERDYHDNYW